MHRICDAGGRIFADKDQECRAQLLKHNYEKRESSLADARAGTYNFQLIYISVNQCKSKAKIHFIAPRREGAKKINFAAWYLEAGRPGAR